MEGKGGGKKATRKHYMWTVVLVLWSQGAHAPAADGTMSLTGRSVNIAWVYVHARGRLEEPMQRITPQPPAPEKQRDMYTQQTHMQGIAHGEHLRSALLLPWFWVQPR